MDIYYIVIGPSSKNTIIGVAREDYIFRNTPVLSQKEITKARVARVARAQKKMIRNGNIMSIHFDHVQDLQIGTHCMEKAPCRHVIVLIYEDGARAEVTMAWGAIVRLLKRLEKPLPTHFAEVSTDE